jgi:NTE family protein
LYALGITAWGYTSSQSVTFYQGADAISPWKRSSRLGIASRIGIEHLVASSAIPFLFPAIKLNREYFGDGSMRQYAPISPALHLGAERVMVIGVRRTGDTPPDRVKVEGYPPPAQIAGHVMGSIFLDNLDVDLERLQRMNNTIQLVPEDRLHCNDSPLRRVESLLISPSREISEMAEQHAHSLPRTIRLFYRAVGAMNRDGSALLSYLLFEKSFCRELIALGYQDTMPRSKEILQFLGFDTTD